MKPPSPRTVEVGTVASVVALSGVLWVGLPSVWATTLLSNIAQCLAPALAATAAWGAARRRTRVNDRRAWRLIAASAASWSAGQMIWTFYEVSGVAAPYPSLADVGYVLAVPLALAGVWSLSTQSNRPSRLIAVLDGLIISAGLIGISWPILLGPSWRAGSDSALEFALTLSYPIGNLAVASSVLLLIMRSERGRDSWPLIYLAAGLLVLTGADSIFVQNTLAGTEQVVSAADVMWVAGYLAIFLAGQRQRNATGVVEREHEVGSMLRALLPFTVVMIGVVVRTVLIITGHRTDSFLSAVTLATVALFLLRYLLTLRENQQLTNSLEHKIGELTVREEQLSHQAFHDPLTGLANRRLFSDRVDHALTRSRRTGEGTAVLFVDLDDFKTVNDSLGHAAGDRLLVIVGARLSGCVRPGDTVARLGGDEFGILLEEVESPEQPAEVAARIMAALDVPFPLDGRNVYTRASIGLATPESLDREPDGAHLLADADVALYAAKSAGKATFRRFERTMRVAAVERLELGQDLRRALEQHQFLCHYQPIVDLVNGRIVAVEALVRWAHPDRGLVEAGEFVGMAEETGLIGGIGRAVLEESARQLVTWQQAGVVPRQFELHVNVSGRQLQDGHLVDEVRRVLSLTGLAPAALVLEITESVAVNVGAHHVERLEELRGLGVRLAIDDFGTGYSSLNYLRMLPLDVLKIDRAFAETDDGATDPVLLEAIVKLGRSLGIETVAEGIERPEQAATLRRLGCRRAQGFLFSRAVPAVEIPALVRLAREPATPPPSVSDPPVTYQPIDRL